MRIGKHGRTQGEPPPQPATLWSGHGHGHAALDGPAKIARARIIATAVLTSSCMDGPGGLPEGKGDRADEEDRSAGSKEVKRY